MEVSAASLYEACVLALAEFRRTVFADATFGLATQLRVSVQAPSTAHTVSVAKLRAWLAGGSKSPNEQVAKKRLRDILGV